MKHILFVIILLFISCIPIKISHIEKIHYSEIVGLWEKKNVPIDCFYDDTVVNRYWLNLYNNAVDEINLTVRVDVLGYCIPYMKHGPFPNRLNRVILYTVDDEIDSAGVCYYKLNRLGMLNWARVVMNPDRPRKYHYSVMIHELGHALGLKHDYEDYTSAMFPLTRGIERFFQQIDMETLRKAYE